ncbi:hypothetical protein BB561_003552 [Smittium simulii]|uniref:SURF1-like protein n=1 Tax=Smittium simulii TaxID=133385 RepID=A0A2T9YKM8_9FUNG|nr:hypothetical protein BB561_003552 [Smittium simulii]
MPVFGSIFNKPSFYFKSNTFTTVKFEALNKHLPFTKAKDFSLFKRKYVFKSKAKLNDQSVLELQWRKKFYSLKTLSLLSIPVISFGLGWWQYQRLHWKTDLINKISDRIDKEPETCPLSLSEKLMDDWQYRKVFLVGTFDHSKEMLVGPVSRDGVHGYKVITPLVREDGSKVLVQRGWVQGKVKIFATVSLGQKPNFTTPDSKPEKNEWYIVDRNKMAEFSSAQPYIFEQVYRK